LRDEGAYLNVSGITVIKTIKNKTYLSILHQFF